MTRPASSKIPLANRAGGERHDEKGGSQPFDWATLVAQTVHPAKVAIVEALCWVGRPLSATELAAMLEDKSYAFSKIHYHASVLVELGSLEVACSRQIRGACEYFYAITRVKRSAC
jgi:hypothetical protein